MKKQLSALAAFVLSTNVFASNAVILECGEYNFTPGINITNVSSTLQGNPAWLVPGASCSNAIAMLLAKDFKIENTSTTLAQFFAQDNTVHSYTLISH